MKKLTKLSSPVFFILKNNKFTLYLFSALCLLSFKINILNDQVDDYSTPLQVQELNIGNLLSWKTSFKENEDLFVVEKATDGITFKEIGSINVSRDTTDEKSYRYLDTSLGMSKSYYRLKVGYKDGSFSYSQVASINKLKPNQFSVVAYSSVLADKTFDITIDALMEGQLEYELVSYQGELIYTEFQYLYPGLNELQMSLVDLTANIYKVKLRVENEEEILVIQKAGETKEVNMASTQKIGREVLVIQKTGDELAKKLNMASTKKIKEHVDATLRDDRGSVVSVMMNDDRGSVVSVMMNEAKTIEVTKNDFLSGTIDNFEVIYSGKFGKINVDSLNQQIVYMPVNNICGIEDSFQCEITTKVGTSRATIYVNILCEELTVLSGFSPNGDRINDNFKIIGIDNFKDNELVVFNSRGNEVYAKVGYQNEDAWDGTWSGQLLPDDLYFFMLKVIDQPPISDYVQIYRN